MRTRTHQIGRGSRLLIACALLPLLCLPVRAAAQDHHAELIGLFETFADWRESAWDGGLGDYGPERVQANLRRLGELQNRLQSVPAAALEGHNLADYLVVRAEMDRQEFILRVTRPWQRDPVFYVSRLLPVAFTELPARGESLRELRGTLRAIPAYLQAARENLNGVAADYADLAIRSLVLSDGVENGYPYRADPPDGVIGWYEDLLARANAEEQPASAELRSEIRAALEALRDFHAWLEANRDSMTADNGVGEAALDWFVQNALLLPYSSREMVTLSQRELDRLWAFYALERHRNRGLPEIEIAGSRDEYQARIAATDRKVREWLREEEIISIPDYIPTDWRKMGYNVPWIERATPPNFWEQVQFRDPAPDHLHAVIPGHRFDALVAANEEHPIRGQVNFGARWQGWAVYLEEGPLQLGLFEDEARTRELIYIFGIWRAARALGDIYNQWNTMNSAEVVDYWREVTPLLDPDVARKYAYLRPSPGHGLEYTIGNLEMFQLLAERKRQLREDFVLRDFHDEIMALGRIPLSLVRYQMTGYRGDVERFLNRQPLEAVIER
jgi:hypothetical protein